MASVVISILLDNAYNVLLMTALLKLSLLVMTQKTGYRLLFYCCNCMFYPVARF